MSEDEVAAALSEFAVPRPRPRPLVLAARSRTPLPVPGEAPQIVSEVEWV
ncbi:hypothetical protein [Streptomyces sp. NPDC054783]